MLRRGIRRRSSLAFFMYKFSEKQFDILNLFTPKEIREY